MGDRKCKFCGKQRASGELFHKFPVNNPDLVRKWIINAKLPAEFVPTINDILCADHFAKSSYRSGSSKRLWDDAVPTLFVFPESSPYYQKITERKPPTKRPPPMAVIEVEKPSKIVKVDSSPTKDDLLKIIATKEKQLAIKRREVKTLKQTVRRRNSKVATLKSIIDELKEKDLLAPSVADALAENFSGLTGELISNHFNNMNRKATGVRYTDDVKKFALTLHFYSPRAYDYVRLVFRLPDARSIL